MLRGKLEAATSPSTGTCEICVLLLGTPYTYVSDPTCTAHMGGRKPSHVGYSTFSPCSSRWLVLPTQTTFAYMEFYGGTSDRRTDGCSESLMDFQS